MDSKNNQINSWNSEEELKKFKQNFLQQATKKLSHSESEIL
jgi:hypothetical protein